MGQSWVSPWGPRGNSKFSSPSLINTSICLAGSASEAPLRRVLSRTKVLKRSSRRGARAMPGVPGPGSPDYTSRRAPRGGAAGRRGAASGLASAVCLLPAAPVRECQPGGGTRRPPRPRPGRDRPTDRGRDRRTQRPREEPRARSGPGPHERAVSGESAAAGASRRGGTQPWTGSWGEWGPLRVPPCGALPPRPRRPRCRAAPAPRAALVTNQFLPAGAGGRLRLSPGRPWVQPPAPAGTTGCTGALRLSRAVPR